MGTFTGGSADKLGNRYEGIWTAKQLLRLLSGEVQSVRLEALEPAAGSADLFLTLLTGNVEAHQCKKRDSKDTWTIRSLAAANVFAGMRDHLHGDPGAGFLFVSNKEPSDLKQLTESARLFRNDPDGFRKSIASTARAQDDWELFCSKAGFDKDNPEPINFLARTEFALFGNDTRSRSEVHTVAGLLLEGDPADVVLRFADFALENLCQPIHADQLRRFIQAKTTFKLRDLAFSSDLSASIERLQSQYSQSVQPYLIDGQVIAGPETKTLLKAIEERSRTRIHCLHGQAGQGKSCVVHELTAALAKAQIPYLPIRFDQRLPKNTTRAFGESLGLPESPARCLKALAGQRPAVLILDQMDALRWNPRHDPSAWDVFTQLVGESLYLGPNVLPQSELEDACERVSITCTEVSHVREADTSPFCSRGKGRHHQASRA